jgi:hypothetical protein
MCGDPFSNYCEHNHSTVFIHPEEGAVEPDCDTLLFFSGSLSVAKVNEIEAEIDKETDENNKRGISMLRYMLTAIKCMKAAKKARKARFEYGESG